MISICPTCSGFGLAGKGKSGELERQQNVRVEEVQGEYHPYEAEVAEWIWICDVCLKWWRTVVPRREEV